MKDQEKKRLRNARYRVAHLEELREKDRVRKKAAYTPKPVSQTFAALARFASDPRTSALGRAGKAVSPWRFGIPGCRRKPPKPEWLK